MKIYHKRHKNSGHFDYTEHELYIGREYVGCYTTGKMEVPDSRLYISIAGKRLLRKIAIALVILAGIVMFTTKAYAYDTNLKPGTRGAEVVKVQTFLQKQGLLDEVTGYYGVKTTKAVKQYQAKRGILQTGNWYQLTRTQAKKDDIATSATTTPATTTPQVVEKVVEKVIYLPQPTTTTAQPVPTYDTTKYSSEAESKILSAKLQSIVWNVNKQADRHMIQTIVTPVDPKTNIRGYCDITYTGTVPPGQPTRYPVERNGLNEINLPAVQGAYTITCYLDTADKDIKSYNVN